MVALGMPSASDPANENFIASVNASLVQAQIPPVASLTDVSERLPNVETGLAQYTDVDAVQKIAALEQRLSAVPSVSALAHAATSYLADRRRCVDEEQKLKGHFYSEILENGLRWIQEDGLDRCPLCDSLIDAAAVAEYVSRKLAESERLRALRERQAQSHEDFLRAIVDHRRALASVAALWSDALGAAFPKQATDLLAQLAVLEVAHSRIATVDAIKLVAPTILAQQVDELPRELLAEIEEKKAILPDVKRYTDLFAAKACLLAYAVHWPQLSAAQTEIARLTTSLEQIRHICELAEQGRKKAVQKLMDKTADLANEYFMKIHPDEGIGKPSLTVTERGKASLALTGRFYSKETDPRGHYSEGHLDSLGLCMFLAIRRLHHRQFSDLSILILDDVLHSVDGRHRRATADLIFDEFKDHQIVVTTHDPLWFENLKAAARRYFPGRAFTQHRIADWSIKVGPVWGDHLSDYEWLCSPVGVAARPADRVSKAGRLLEEMLHNLCDGLQAPVPFKLRGDYTLDPLWTSFVKAANKYRGFSPGGHTAIDEIDQLRILRNLVGAHWNEWAAHLTDSESRDLCSAVVALRAAVYCPTCERFVARVPRPADLCTCECGAIQYKK